MEKEKMIEEMAKDIPAEMKDPYQGSNITVLYSYQRRKQIAKSLVSKNYRKVPNSAVVLTKEEYIRLASYISEERAREIFHEETKKLKEAISKETAKQSCDDLIKIIKNNTDLNASVFGWTTEFILNMIKMYFKEKYGVEVEE